MLRIKLLHPNILRVFGSSGHGAQILIADGNYPFSTGAPEKAEKVFLNLMSGIVRVSDVFRALVEIIPIGFAIVMVSPKVIIQIIVDEYQDILPKNITIQALKRFKFYEKSKSSNTALVITTGDGGKFANILLTIGVVRC
jgi:L-fucose mutarotase